jgi:hypothetical protein
VRARGNSKKPCRPEALEKPLQLNHPFTITK